MRQYYSKAKPNRYENVLVTFLLKNNDFFEGELIEYDFKCSMNLSDATKKKKIKSWNGIVNLNRQMVARVEDVDNINNIVEVSIAYYTEKESQTELMKYFMKNLKLLNFIKSSCIKFNINYNDIWCKYIYKIDEEKDDENILDYMIENVDDIELPDNILNLFKEKFIKKDYNIKTNIGIISFDGIQAVKALIENVKNNIDFDFEFKYLSTPNYCLETNNNDENDIFINTLKNINTNKNIFIKI